MSNFSDFSQDGYQIIRELGRNREAGRITYLATALNSNQQVVIKEFRFAVADASWSGFKAYEREIEVLQQLDHPRIPRYLDSLETPQGFCLVQEYKNALSLSIKRSFTREQIKQIAVSVLEILVYLQKRIPPVIHRDIKPENILVDKELNAYLIDFGLARIQSKSMALSSVAAGTPGFMPPEEQFGRPLTEASDLYSLGATLICLLTGTRSLDIGNLIDDNYRFDIKKLLPQGNPRFVQWLTKLVEPNLKNRFSNAAVALAALKPIQVKRLQSRFSTPVVGLATFSFFILLGLTWIGSRQEHSVNPESSSPITTSTLNHPQLPSYSNQAIPFHISSVNNKTYSNTHFVGTFDGEYRIYPTSIEVTVNKATIHRLDDFYYKGRRIINSVGFSLVKDDCRQYSRSPDFGTNIVMNPGDSYTFTSIRFIIPKVRSADLSKYFLVVKMSGRDIDRQGGQSTWGYAESDRNIFASVPPSTEPISPTRLTLNTPTPLRPLNGTVFNDSQWWRKFEWSAVPGAESYTLEIDSFNACELGYWCSDLGRAGLVIPWINKTNYTNHVYNEATRWRVWAVGADGQESPKSDWWEFRKPRHR